MSNLVVRMATFDAAAVFNDGNIARIRVLEKLGFTPGVFMRQILRRIDRQRITLAEARSEKFSQLARQKKRGKKRAAEDQEDDGDYSYGGF